jgi:hypothetical protein
MFFAVKEYIALHPSRQLCMTTGMSTPNPKRNEFLLQAMKAV